MHRLAQSIRDAVFVVLVIAVTAASAQAPSQARVIRDQTIIWRPGFVVIAEVVKAGTVLTVLARAGDWYEVVVPSTEGATGATGFISVSRVELLPGTPPPAERQLSPSPSTTQASGALPRSSAGVWGFGQIGYTAFSAHDSFDAVLGRRGGGFFGGGGEVRFGSWFVSVSAEHFGDQGQRVFVSDGQVYHLGIRDTISIVPVLATGGWRFNRERATPYVGAGVGRYLLKESSDFSNAGEDVRRWFTGYHVVGGVEFRVASWVATGAEVTYSRVPNALGVGGVSSVFDEHNLGGVEGRLRILVGR
jgi:opacity protein-like surface antigen